MKLLPLLLSALLSIALMLSCTNNAPPATPVPASPPLPPTAGTAAREKIAEDIADNLAKKDYAAVRNDFAPIMLDALPESKIKETYEDLIAKIGDFKKVLTTEEVMAHGYHQVKKRCQFARENASVLVSFNEENKVIGLFITL